MNNMKLKKVYTINEVAKSLRIHSNTLRQRVLSGYYLGDHEVVDAAGNKNVVTITKDDIIITKLNDGRNKIRLSQTFYDVAIYEDSEADNDSRPNNDNISLNDVGSSLVDILQTLNKADAGRYSDDELIAVLMPVITGMTSLLSQSDERLENLRSTYSIAYKEKILIEDLDVTFAKKVDIIQRNELIDKARVCLNKWKQGDFEVLSKKDIERFTTYDITQRNIIKIW